MKKLLVVIALMLGMQGMINPASEGARSRPLFSLAFERLSAAEQAAWRAKFEGIEDSTKRASAFREKIEKLNGLSSLDDCLHEVRVFINPEKMPQPAKQTETDSKARDGSSFDGCVSDSWMVKNPAQAGFLAGTAAFTLFSYQVIRQWNMRDESKKPLTLGQYFYKKCMQPFKAKRAGTYLRACALALPLAGLAGHYLRK